MHTLHIVSIGKDSSSWHSCSQMYYKRLSHYWKIENSIYKDAPSSLPIEKRKYVETQHVLGSIHSSSIFVELHPDGKEYSSEGFAQLLSQITENKSKIPLFAIAGAFGFTRELLPKQRMLLSLSKMTFTHEMTKAILIEQLYRATTLLHSIPYHH
ncbi:MAG: 23S rRNA (pseudouridine(1915)-N(3))-methyltransferase RlmH [Desulfovibrionaceae bacterium]